MYLILNIVAVVRRRYTIERAKRAKNKSKDEVDEERSWRTTLLIGPLLCFHHAVWKNCVFQKGVTITNIKLLLEMECIDFYPYPSC